MEGEESVLFPLVSDLGAEGITLFRQVYYSCQKMRGQLLSFVLEALDGPQRVQYMHNIESTMREHGIFVFRLFIF